MGRLRLYAFAIAACLLALPEAARADTFTGTLNIIWGDPKDRASGAGGVFYMLATADGRYVPLQMSGGTNVTALNGKPVVVNGQLAATPRIAGAAGEQPIVVDSIALDRSVSAATRDTGLVSGTKKVLFLLLKFQDDDSEARPDPHASTFFDNLTNPLTPSGSIPATINGFFQKTSNSLFSWVGDVGGVGGVSAPGGPARAWLVLPHPKSYYAPCGFSSTCFTGTNFDNFNSDAALVAGLAGIDLTPYDNINFVVSNDLDCCAWGGNVTIAAKTYGATWEPPWGQEARVYSHEMGHSLGLFHSGWVYYSYDSPWDVMSGYSDAVSTSCGSYYSRNSTPPGTQTLTCDEPGNGYIMAHRDFLGWIPAANQVTVPVGGAINTAIEGGAQAIAGGNKMIKICIPGYSCTGTGSTTRYFTVEARVKNLGSASLYDNGIPNEGVIIHDVWFGRPAISGACFFNAQSGWAVPIDATPGDYTGFPTCSFASGTALYNAQFTPGMVYTNATYDFKVRVNSRRGNIYSISVAPASGTFLALNIAGDFDGDARAEMTTYRTDGTWRILKSTSGYSATTNVSFGGAGYVPVPGDYDGDGRQDPAIYNVSTGQWLALNSTTNYTTTFGQSWGGTGYLPEPGDYDGDGKTDPSLYVQATGQWLILKSSTGYTTSLSVSLGGPGYTAVPGKDFDGDGKSDIVVYREATGYWYVLKSSTNFLSLMLISWGGPGYTLVPGDYDGDGKADAGLYNRATGQWLILKSSTSTVLGISWGGTDYEPVPGDYDGDGKFDAGIVQRSAGTWYILQSSTSYTTPMNVLFFPSPLDSFVSSAIVPVGAGDTKRATDFEGDGTSDITIYNPTTAYWYTLTSSTSYASGVNRNWGGAGYSPVPGDYDGDGKTDYGLYVSSSGAWTILLSGAGYTTSLSKSAGGGTYVPVPADYDGDGTTDIAVYTQSTGNWYILKSSTGFVTAMAFSWGGAGYTATPGDFDGDGKADLGLYQASTGNWYILLSSAGYTTSMGKSAGGPTYTPVQADYDGDGKTDPAVYDQSTGLWYGLKSGSGYTAFAISWGGTGYTPVKGDWDGDGKTDLGIYNGATGLWSILLSGAGYTTSLGKSWGGSGYAPVPQYP